MIYYFNPSCEMAVRQGQSSYTPPKNVAQMEADLSSIVMFLGSDDDCVIGKQADDKLIEFWKPLIGGRNFISDKEAALRISGGEEFAPWGISRATFVKYGLPDDLYRQEYRELLSRKTSVTVEHLIGEKAGDQYPPISKLIEREEELDSHIERLKEEGVKNVVIKSLWSASGRGVRFFNLKDEQNNAVDYATRCMRADGGVVIEKRLERVAEFSYLFHYTKGRIKYDGINIYHSSDNGGMGWEIAGRQPYIFDIAAYEEIVADGANNLGEALENMLSTTLYEGPIGVDAMLYKKNDGSISLRPCTEINMRYCMGHVAQKVANLFAKGTPIKWQMSHFSTPSKWEEFCEEQERLYPTLFNNAGEITSGFFRLTPIGETTQFGAYGWSGDSGVLKE